jgi:hypothetical protein
MMLTALPYPVAQVLKGHHHRKVVVFFAAHDLMPQHCLGTYPFE